MGVFSRGTTRTSGSLSCGARELMSPCAWRGGAGHHSRALCGPRAPGLQGACPHACARSLRDFKCDSWVTEVASSELRNVKWSLGSVQSPDLWEIKVGNAPLLQNQRLLALRNRQPRFPLREEPSVTMEGEWPPLPPQAGWGGGWLAVFANICTWLGCTCLGLHMVA